jgi:hypothetical protein
MASGTTVRTSSSPAARAGAETGGTRGAGAALVGGRLVEAVRLGAALNGGTGTIAVELLAETDVTSAGRSGAR